MNTRTNICLLAITLCGAQANAAVTDADTGGFTTVNELIINAPRADVWKVAVDDIGKWWSSEHTVSGDAGRLGITATPQGCFCEDLGEAAGVVHLLVTMVNPTVVLRMTGGLGPLGLMGVNGNMTWEFSDAGERTNVKFTYAVGGYRAGGLEAISVPVDSVIGGALMRLKSQIETGDPNRVDVE